MLNKLYVPDKEGNYFCGTKDEAITLLFGTQKKVYDFMKCLVNKYDDEFDALAELAEVDHRLDIPDEDFTIDYETDCNSSFIPYTIQLQYGDPHLGYVRMAVNAMSQ